MLKRKLTTPKRIATVDYVEKKTKKLIKRGVQDQAQLTGNCDPLGIMQGILLDYQTLYAKNKNQL